MDERETIRLAQEGSEEAFCLLVKNYQAKVFRMVMNFTQNREIADDLSQDIFLKAYLALPKFRFESEFGTWLYRVAVNRVKDFLRKKGRIKEVSLNDVGELAMSEDSLKKKETEAEHESRKKLVLNELDALPAKYRIVLTLRDIQGLTYEEIVRILKLSPGTVDSRIHRARKMLRKRLAPVLSRKGGM